MKPHAYILTAVVTLLLAATPAATYARNVDPLATAAHAAVQYWGTAPCHGSFTVQWANESEGPAASAGGWTEENGCTAYISTTLWTPTRWQQFYGQHTSGQAAAQRLMYRELCRVVTHEVGHDLGHEHVLNPRDVMNPIMTVGVGPAVERALPVDGPCDRVPRWASSSHETDPVAVLLPPPPTPPTTPPVPVPTVPLPLPQPTPVGHVPVSPCGPPTPLNRCPILHR